GDGAGGDISLTAVGAIMLDGADPGTGRVTISSNAAGSGAAGNVVLSAQTISLLNGGQINASTSGSGAGGNVRVTAAGTILLDGRGAAGASGFSAGTSASGAGGSITVRGSDITLRNGASINAATSGSGNGGSISVIADGSVRLDGNQSFVPGGNTLINA